VTDQRLDVVELVRRIHIGQQAIAAVHGDVLRADHVHVQVFKEIQHLQSALGQASDDCGMAGASIDCAQWMISAFGPRHDSIHGTTERQQAGQEIGRHKGHVTGDHQKTVVAGSLQGRVQATKRTAVRHPIADTTKTLAIVEWTGADEQNIVREPVKRLELPVEDRASGNTQQAFIAAFEAPRLTAGENRSACHP